MVRTRVFYGTLMSVALVVLTITDAFLSRASLAERFPICRILGYGGLTTLIAGLIMLGGAVELCRLCRKAGHKPLNGWCITMVALAMLAPWFASTHGKAALTQINPSLGHLASLDAHLLWIAILGVGFIYVWRQQTDGAIAHLGVSLLVILYIGFLGSFIVRLRCWQPGPEGSWVLLASVAAIKLTDIAAYFTGMAIGKTPLIVKVSPKKTWEGTIGGVLVAGLASTLFLGVLIPKFNPGNLVSGLNLMQAFVFGVVMGGIGQIGDLAESLFKRDSGAKDSAKIVPEFGGVLDVIDSPLFGIPVAWGLLHWWVG